MKKIMFNDKYGLTKAVLEGRKTMTRRVISDTILRKLESFKEEYYEASLDVLDGKDLIEAYFVNHPKSLPYHVGDVVAVAQRLCDVYAEFDKKHLGRDTMNMMLKFGGSPGFRNKMFVSADEMPHRIRITGVRVERLQDISDKDCLKEGIVYSKLFNKYYFESDMAQYSFISPREAYASLIDKVSGRGTWLANPCVLVYEFELVS